MIYSPLVNFVRTHDYAMFLKKSITWNVCKVHALLGSVYGINLQQSRFFHLIRQSSQSGVDARFQLWPLLDFSTVQQLEQVVFNPDLAVD